MRRNGYPPAFADRIFGQIRGFADYGFPESHSASFALLAYVSSWLKHYEPVAFLAAMLISQPMGFYTPAQLVQDARRHGVEVLAPDITVSDWECTLEPQAASCELRATSHGPRVAGCGPRAASCHSSLITHHSSLSQPAVRLGLL